tara:strand:- start:122 stop:709 length:588 start_codon:yes stop_codon:yes gene_type:complete
MTITINGNGTVTGVSVGGLPDGIVDTDMIAASAVTAAKSSGSAKGITEFDMWRVTSNFTQQNADITSNWERADTNFEKIGTGLTESSGIFTFPSNGIWLVGFMAYIWTSAAPDHAGISIKVSNNSGGSYDVRTETLTSVNDDELAASLFTTTCLDISNAAAMPMKFTTVAAASISWNGHTDQQRTGFWTLKLGDT